MKKERLPGTLKLRGNRPLKTDLAGHGFSKDIIEAALPLYNRLEADARLWIIRGGFVERGPITRRDAEAVWRVQFAKAGAK